MNLFDKINKMKILLIDDDEWIRDSLRLFFEGEGCNLPVFETAEEGLKSFKNNNYNIIISDYRLPGMDGLEFFKKILQSHPETKAILITAYGSEDVIRKAKNMGIQEIINKPFTTLDIEKSLSRLIDYSGQKRESSH